MKEQCHIEIVFLTNDRCDQENLIAQLKSGVKALAMPVDDLVNHRERDEEQARRGRGVARER